jgi:hypothetical protein
MVCAKASLSTQLLLPLAEAIYDSLEIGISAHSFGPNPATVYVDDVAISDKPID